MLPDEQHDYGFDDVVCRGQFDEHAEWKWGAVRDVGHGEWRGDDDDSDTGVFGRRYEERRGIYAGIGQYAGPGGHQRRADGDVGWELHDGRRQRDVYGYG